MRFKHIGAACVSLGMALAATQPAMAQSGDYDALMAMDEDSLEDALTMRFDAALAATGNPAVVAADDPRYLWAQEAKAQCGIALGYLKSSTKDPVSIRRCERAYALMQYVPVPPPAPTPAPTPPPADPQVCENPALIFFEFDNPVPPMAEAQQVVEFIAANYQGCNWDTLTVVGHADRSGSDSYNLGLSQERANNVADMLRPAVPGATVTAEARGESQPRVPTEDGVRELQNRRVEIQVR